MNTLRLLAFTVLVAVATASKAAPRLIDFTDAVAWAAADGTTSFSRTYGTLAVTLNSLQSNRPLTFNAGGPISPAFLRRNGFGIGILDDVISRLEPNDNDDLLEVKFSQNVNVTSLYFLKHGSRDVAQANFGRNGPNTILRFSGNASEFGAFEGLSVTNFDDIHFTGNGYSLAAIGLDGFVIPPLSPPTVVSVAFNHFQLSDSLEPTFTQVGGRPPITWDNFELASFEPHIPGVILPPLPGSFTFDPDTQVFHWESTGYPRGVYVWSVRASNEAGSSTGTLTVRTVIPEPTSTTISMLVLIGIAGICRRR